MQAKVNSFEYKAPGQIIISANPVHLKLDIVVTKNNYVTWRCEISLSHIFFL